ncbi:MAG: hypothetical protein JWQ09_5515, partial [Segetibacter sp.]|nr:hypothetical protein [Segetibacter sp.]
RFSSEKAFTAMIELTAICNYKYGFKVPKLLQLLYSMRYNQTEYKKEWEFWQQAVQRVLNGVVRCRIIFSE